MLSGNPPKLDEYKTTTRRRQTHPHTRAHTGWLMCYPGVASLHALCLTPSWPGPPRAAQCLPKMSMNSFARDLFRFRLQLSDITMADGNQRRSHC